MYILLKIFLMEFVNFCDCFMERIFLENNNIPHGLYFFKKDISFADKDFPFIPQINDL